MLVTNSSIGSSIRRMFLHPPEALGSGLLLLLEGLEEGAPVEERGAGPGGGVDGVVQQCHGAVQTHVALVRPEHFMMRGKRTLIESLKVKQLQFRNVFICSFPLFTYLCSCLLSARPL